MRMSILYSFSKFERYRRHARLGARPKAPAEAQGAEHVRAKPYQVRLPGAMDPSPGSGFPPALLLPMP